MTPSESTGQHYGLSMASQFMMGMMSMGFAHGFGSSYVSKFRSTPFESRR
jgi:hypothetical protein